MLHRHAVLRRLFPTVVACLALTSCGLASSPGQAAASFPSPAVNLQESGTPGLRTAVFAGGCFWGMQWVFEHVHGVRQVTAGYAGGSRATARYPIVSGGGTGHAESIRIRYDPTRVSYGQLLRVYFAVATDPTQRDRQGPDVGRQYRGVIFYTSAAQQRMARAYIDQLVKARVFDAPIVTQVVALPAFYPAEPHHQDYARRHRHDLYIMVNDAPKIDALRQRLPTLYRAEPTNDSP